MTLCLGISLADELSNIIWDNTISALPDSLYVILDFKSPDNIFDRMGDNLTNTISQLI